MSGRLLLRGGLVCILLIAAWSSAFADPCSDEKNFVQNNGECWRSMTPIEKSSIIRGIWVGKSVRTSTLQMSGQTGSIYFGMDWSSIPEETSIGDITDYFDRLYETPANRKIEWHNAYLLAALMARDDDENDRLSLLTFLRSNPSLPNSGTLVGAKAPNVVNIQAGLETYEVRIAGIKIPDLEADNVKIFVGGLKQGAWGDDCSNAVATPVTLYYRTELFDAEGRLTADVRIDSGYNICQSGKAIPIAAPGAAFTNLGYFLVRNGLAELDTRVDLKWSDERKQTLWNEYATEQAREEKLYMHGGAKNAVVEMVSGRLPPDTY